MATKAADVIDLMVSMLDEQKRHALERFFKTAEGQYGYGDKFLGIKTPEVRAIVRQSADMELCEIPQMLASEWHEIRLCGFLIMVRKFEKLSARRLIDNEEAVEGRDSIVTLYLEQARKANNWDLVDLTVHKILGSWYMLPTRLGSVDGSIGQNKSHKLDVLDRLAASDNLWEQRMSIVCSWKTSAAGDPSVCLRYSLCHLGHRHDLMHKAVGWMLREMGKRVSMDLLREFLEQHWFEMSRTTLRYAIERMSIQERQYWMKRTK